METIRARCLHQKTMRYSLIFLIVLITACEKDDSVFGDCPSIVTKIELKTASKAVYSVYSCTGGGNFTADRGKYHVGDTLR